MGTRGIEPLRTIIEQRRVPGDLESFSGTPTLIWLLDWLGVEAGAAADACSLLGAILAGAAALGLLGGCTPLFVALSLLYLAVISPLAATARGSSLPWAELPADGLLLEAAFAASLWAPLWPKGKEEELEGEAGQSEDGGGGSRGKKPAPLSASALAPAFLLRWIVAKNAFSRGLCRWNSEAAAALSTSSLVALVADVALAPLALSPARLPRLVAAAALLASWMIDVVSQFPSASKPSSTSPAAAVAALWTCLLRLALVLPLFHAGLLDSGSGGRKKKSGSGSESSGESKIKAAARLLVSAAAAVPALFSALAVLSHSRSRSSLPSSSSSSSPSSFESSLSEYAPYCLPAAGLTMLASLAADVLRSMSSASIGLEGGEGEKNGSEERKKPTALPATPSTRRERRRREEKTGGFVGNRQSRRRAQKVEYVRGAHEAALVGAISLMLFCAGCLEVSSSVSSPAAAAADRGCSGGPGCGGGPAALVVARRLSWLAAPWRATGPSFQSMMREEGEGGLLPSRSGATAAAAAARRKKPEAGQRSPLARAPRASRWRSPLFPRRKEEATAAPRPLLPRGSATSSIASSLTRAGPWRPFTVPPPLPPLLVLRPAPPARSSAAAKTEQLRRRPGPRSPPRRHRTRPLPHRRGSRDTAGAPWSSTRRRRGLAESSRTRWRSRGNCSRTAAAASTSPVLPPRSSSAPPRSQSSGEGPRDHLQRQQRRRNETRDITV